MAKVIVTALALSALLATGCQTLGFMSSEEAPATSSTKPPKVAPAKPTTSTPKYEHAPDTTGAEVLTTKHAGAGISADEYQGNLITDASGPISMETDPNAVRSGVALSSNLEPAPGTINAQLGAADPYSSVTEIGPDYGNVLNGSIAAEGANNRSGLSHQAAPVGAAAPNYEQINVTPVLSVSEARGLDDGSCSMTLHYEASGLARSLIAELAGRLRSESGKIFVGPTIIDREYEDCVSDLSSAIQDGLVGNASFEVVPATTNLNNIIAQNIGSATILPSMIHQCRAADIPYLVVSQIRKTGDKAALTLRIIRTSDGITLNQVYRRLSQ